MDKEVAPGTFPRKILAPGLEKYAKTTNKLTKTKKKLQHNYSSLVFCYFFLVALGPCDPLIDY